jgi:hypothetical protein
MAKSLEQQNRDMARGISDLYDNRKDMIPNQRFNYDVGSLFGVTLNPNAEPGYHAYVNPGDPNNIYFRPLLADEVGLVPEVLAHESEHILEQRASKRYNKKQPVFDFFLEALQTTVPGSKKVNWSGSNEGSKLYRNFFNAANSDKKVAERLYDLGLSPYVGYIGEDLKRNSMREILASLSGFETASNVDITQDPVLRKELFQDSEELIQAYKAVTGLRQERLDAKDIAPYTSTMPPVKEKSYRERIMDLFTNPLMEDTTK